MGSKLFVLEVYSYFLSMEMNEVVPSMNIRCKSRFAQEGGAPIHDIGEWRPPEFTSTAFGSLLCRSELFWRTLEVSIAFFAASAANVEAP